MSSIAGLEWTFNTVAGEFDKWAPGYVPELYGDLFAYCPVNGASEALEIGMGTGQATRPVLDTGCRVTAVELGDNLARIAADKFRDYPNFSVRVMPFQDYVCPDGTYDLCYSASAFHWIPEETGYPAVYRMLKRGGAFARFAKHPYYDEDDMSLWEDMQKVYGKYMTWSSSAPRYTREMARQRAEIARKYGFADIACETYLRARTYDAASYARLIATYSDHIVMPEDMRPGFYGGIRDAIEKHGGAITLHDIIDLQLARKP